MPALVSAKDLNLQYGLQAVLQNATMAVEDGEKLALVGRNGAGKSSLMKIIAGLEKPDSGIVSRRTDLRIGWLSQEFSLREDATVRENILDGAAELLAMVERYESGKVKGAEETLLLDRIQASGAWEVESRVDYLINELHCPPADVVVRPLSGGEKRRVALAQALISQPDLLLLDEPTNHLDAESIAWLEQYLITYRGGCLFVTHDRYFLDRIAQRIVELEDGRIYSHPGNYTHFLVTKAERQGAANSAEDRRQKLLKVELEFVRSGVKARRTKSRHRVDQYYQLAAQDGPSQDWEVELLIPPPPPLANIVVDARQAGVRFGDRVLFDNFDFSFEPGSITGVVGRNGAGKTTLLRTLMGEMQPTKGMVEVGKRTIFNYVDQQRLALDGTRSVLEELAGNSDFINFGDQKLHVRTYLKRFHFTEDRVLQRVDRLSGGERSRLLLAKILIRGGNFLILDEPTNDLDLQTLEVLEEALLDFPGCVLLVSHDRYFLDKTCDRVLVFEPDGDLHLCSGNYRYYLEKNATRLQEARSAARAYEKARQESVELRMGSGGAAEPQKGARSVKPPKLTFKEQKELEGMEAAIGELEEKIAQDDVALNDPSFYVKQGTDIAHFMQQLDQSRAALVALYARWEELEAKQAAFLAG